MQSFTVIDPSTTLEDSLDPLMGNDKTSLSNSAGTAFPTTNLIIGMSCYRTDQQKLYILQSTGPSVWNLLADLSKAPLQTDGSGNATVTGTLTAGAISAGATTISAALSAASAAIAGTLTVGDLLSASKAINFAKAADLASASTVNIGAAAGNYLNVTGSTTITAFDTVQAGAVRVVNFTGALTLTHNATSLILPGAASIKTSAGDIAKFVSLGSGNWICAQYQRKNGQSVSALGAETSIASATATDLGSLGSNQVQVTGTTTITGFGSSASIVNPVYIVRFAAALTLTYDATAMILPGGVSIKTAAGDSALMLYLGSGNWRCLSYTKANGQVFSATGAESSISSNTTTDLGSLGTNVAKITGTNAITSFGSGAAVLNPIYFIRFDNALTLTHNATSLILPGGASVVTAAGDAAIVIYLGSGNWKCLIYQPASGQAVIGNLNSPAFTGTPTAPTAALNTISTQIATCAFANPGNSLAGNGYCKLPSGLIIQWGNGSYSFNGVNALPIAFPNTGLAIVTVNTNTTNSSGWTCGAYFTDNANFAVNLANVGSGDARWFIALGY